MTPFLRKIFHEQRIAQDFSSVFTAAAPIVGGLLGADASNSAANTQADAADRSAQATLQAQRETNDLNKYMYDTSRGDQLPFLQTGQAANAELAQLLGIGPNTSGRGDYGYLRDQFNMNDLQKDVPYQLGYQNALDQGLLGVNRLAAASGSLNSGATLKALQDRAANVANQYAGDAYNRYEQRAANTYNRLAGLSGAGQTTANSLANSGSNYANSNANASMGTANALSNIYTGAANSRAASGIAGANSLAGGLNSVSNYYQTQNLLSSLAGGNKGGSSAIYGNNDLSQPLSAFNWTGFK